MKRLTLILMMLSFAVPTWALAELEIHMEQKEENGRTKISSISTMQLIYQMNVKFIFCVKKCSIILKFPNML